MPGDRDPLDDVLGSAGPGDGVRPEDRHGPLASLARGRARIDADPDNVEKGLAQLVLTIVELLRQVLERQAIRRMEGGSLDDEEVERLGQALMALADRMDELKEVFGLDDDDLNLDLGPLGQLLER